MKAVPVRVNLLRPRGARRMWMTCLRKTRSGKSGSPRRFATTSQRRKAQARALGTEEKNKEG